MKKQIAALSLAALSLAACNSDNEPKLPAAGANSAVSLRVEQNVSRAITSTAGVTSFVEGDVIALYSTGLATDMAATEFTVGADGLLSSIDRFVYDGDKGASFYAFFPVTAESTSAQASLTVDADQSADGAFQANDFMTATATVPTGSVEPVTLKFGHRMSLVQVAITGVTPASVALQNVATKATWTYADNAVATDPASAANVAMGLNSEAGSYWAIVPAQTIAGGSVMLKVSAEGRELTYTPSADVVLSSGKTKKITLAARPDDTLVLVKTEMDTPWEDEDADQGELDKTPLVTPVANIRTLTGDRSALNPGEWGSIFNVADFEATTQLVDGGFIFDVTACKGGSWYNRTVYNRVSTPLDPAKKYTLRFTAEADQAAQLQVLFSSFDAEKKNVFHMISGYNNVPRVGGYQLVNVTTEAKTFAIEVTPGMVALASNITTESGYTATTDAADLFISFAANFEGARSITLTNITLIEN